MSKAQAIKERRFEWMPFRNEGKTLKGQKDVHKKPFGAFTVYFELNSNTGRTKMRIWCWLIKEFDKDWKSYKTFECAVEAAKKYFDEMDEIAKKLPKQAQIEANEAYYRKVLAWIWKNNLTGGTKQ